MIVGIDNVSTGLATSPVALGGMRNYLEHFVTSLATWGTKHKYVLFSPDWFESPFDKDIPCLQDVRVGNVPVNRFGRVLFEQTAYRNMIYRHRPDVFVGLQNTLPIGLRIPSVVLVKSIQYLLFPEAYSTLRLLYLRWAVRMAIHSATYAIVPAISVGNDLARVLGISSNKIEVMPEALYFDNTNVLQDGEEARFRQKIEQFTTGKPYVLCVGATYGYKNLERLIRAFAKFRSMQGSRHVLLLIGGEAGTSFERIHYIAEEVGLGDDVICCGICTQAELIVAYGMADMMVMPSLYETFGHPILEAMACGCPVVTSNVSAMPEVAGDAAELVDPYDIDKIAGGMLRVACDSDYRTRLVDLGRRRATEFSWERIATQTLEMLERARSSTAHL
jgi:glycosyltransferase involved in cell wall biosynthesis